MMMVVFGGVEKMCVISKNEAKFCHRNTAILAPGSWIFLFLTVYYLLGWSVNKEGKLFQNNQMENHKLSETWERIKFGQRRGKCGVKNTVPGEGPGKSENAVFLKNWSQCSVVEAKEEQVEKDTNGVARWKGPCKPREGFCSLCSG